METNQNITSAGPSKTSEILRKTVLAVIGAGAVTVEVVRTTVERLVQRGERADKEMRERNEIMKAEQVMEQAEKSEAAADLEVLTTRLEQLKAELNTLTAKQAQEEGPQL